MFKNNKNLNFLILVILLIILLLIFSTLSNIVYIDIIRKFSFETDIVKKYEINSNSVFCLDKIFIFSSADGVNNPVNNKALWDINISQFSDIAIYINNNRNDGLNFENSVKKLYISNIKYNETPTLGTYNLYYKDINDFGKLSYLEENGIGDDFSFNIVYGDNMPNYSNKELHTSLSSPICFTFVNKDIKNNCIVSDITNPLTYDGSLLQRCNIPLHSINCNFSFNINIINNLEQHFVCNVNIDVPLKDDDMKTSIYDGKFQKEITNLSKYKFYRIQ